MAAVDDLMAEDMGIGPSRKARKPLLDFGLLGSALSGKSTGKGIIGKTVAGAAKSVKKFGIVRSSLKLIMLLLRGIMGIVVGLVGTGGILVALVLAAFAILYRKSEGFKALVDGVFKFIGAGIKVAWTLVKAVFKTLWGLVSITIALFASMFRLDQTGRALKGLGSSISEVAAHMSEWADRINEMNMAEAFHRQIVRMIASAQRAGGLIAPIMRLLFPSFYRQASEWNRVAGERVSKDMFATENYGLSLFGLTRQDLPSTTWPPRNRFTNPMGTFNSERVRAYREWVAGQREKRLGEFSSSEFWEGISSAAQPLSLSGPVQGPPMPLMAEWGRPRKKAALRQG